MVEVWAVELHLLRIGLVWCGAWLYPCSFVHTHTGVGMGLGHPTDRYAMQRGAPPIVFSHLLQLPPGALEAYLHCRLPHEVDAAAMAARLAATRKPISFLRQREARYASLQVEPLCAAMARSLVAADAALHDALDAASVALLLSP